MTAPGAAAFLEELQEQAFAATGIGPSSLELIEAFSAETGFMERLAGSLDIDVPQLRRTYAGIFARGRALRPTRFEDPSWYTLLVDMADTVEDAARALGWLLPARPVFGTLPLGQVNARAIAVPGSHEHLIVFQQGLFTFMNLLAKAVAAPAGLDSADRLFDLLRAYVVEGDPRLAQPYLASGLTAHASTRLRMSGETFVLAHEYGHLLAGHLDSTESHARPLGDSGIDVIQLRWQQEFEADRLGLELAVVAMANQGTDLAACFVGIDLVLSGLELVGRAINLLVHGRDDVLLPSETHPPPAERRAKLRRELGGIIDDHSEAKRAQAGADGFDEVVASLWAPLAGRFRDLHERGERPAGIWTALTPPAAPSSPHRSQP